MPTVTVAVPTQNTLGEGTLWDARTHTLWWLDIPHGTLHAWDPTDNTLTTHSLGEPTGCLGLRAAGGLVVARASGLYAWEDGQMTLLAPATHAKPSMRFNDGNVTPDGRFLAGTADADDGLGVLARLDADGALHTLLGGLRVPNGLRFSPDGRTLYLADTPTGVIQAYDYEPAHGTLGNARPFVTLDDGSGMPDGMAVDSDGGLWVCLWDGARVVRFQQDGTLDTEVALPVACPTRPTFGGPDLDVLYVTSAREGQTADALAAQPDAGAVFAITGTGRTGVPEAHFTG